MGNQTALPFVLGMIEYSNTGISLFKFANLNGEENVVHFVTTRKGGVSESPYASLNLGYHNKDSALHVAKNREILSSNGGVSISSLTLGQQVHSGNVHVVGCNDIGRGSMSFESEIRNTDEMVTNVPNACLMVLVADCAPVLFFDAKQMVIAIAHSGRKGVINRVSENVVETMDRQYGCKRSDINVGIGPTICRKHYPITQEAETELRGAIAPNSTSIEMANGQTFFDLTGAIKEQLVSCGVKEGHIETAGICTYERSDIFFSERRDGPPTGRFGAVIMLRFGSK